MSDQTIPNGLKFLFGGLSGMGATAVVQPLDLLKTRMQLSAKNEYRSSLHCLQAVVTKEGPLAVYRGLSAALVRQATYTTTRLGVYTYLNDAYQKRYHKRPSFLVLVGMGMTAGATGAMVGNPAEVALIRMSSDGRLPAAERRNYRNVFDAFGRVVKEEGAVTLLSGVVPTVGRAIVVNVGQLTMYTHSKNLIVDKWHVDDGIALHFMASMVSGLVTSVASLPLDNAKTRLQNMKTVDGQPEYTGMFDVLRKVIKGGGVLALWKGLTPYYCRLGPYTVLMFVFLERFNAMYLKFVATSDF